MPKRNEAPVRQRVPGVERECQLCHHRRGAWIARYCRACPGAEGAGRTTGVSVDRVKKGPRDDSLLRGRVIGFAQHAIDRECGSSADHVVRLLYDSHRRGGLGIKRGPQPVGLHFAIRIYGPEMKIIWEK